MMNLDDIKESFLNLPLEDKKSGLSLQIKELLEIMNKIIAEEQTNYFVYDKNNPMDIEQYLSEEFVQIVEIKQKLIDIFK